MKQIFTGLLIILSYNAFGQNQLLGIEGGLNQTNVNSEPFLIHPDKRNGLSFGLNYEYIFNNKLSISTGFTYNEKGFRDKVEIIDQNQNFIGEKYFRSNFDYISMPIKTGFSIGNIFFGFAKIGIVPSLLVSAKIVMPKIDSNGMVNGYHSVSVSDQVTKFDLAGLGEIGGGYKLKNRYWLIASFGYQQSFTSLGNDDYLEKVKHRGTNLSIGIKYLLKKNN